MKQRRIFKILIICLTVTLVHSIAFAASNDRAIIFRPKTVVAPTVTTPVTTSSENLFNL